MRDNPLREKENKALQKFFEIRLEKSYLYYYSLIYIYTHTHTVFLHKCQ